ncbi:MAG: DinB family protein [Fimbriimonadaceae bacterium]
MTNAAKSLKGACKVFLQDLQALPEEAFDKSFGPKTRTVADIVFEVNLVNDHACLVIQGEVPFTWPDEGWIKAPEDLRTKEVVIASFEKASGQAMSIAESLSQEQIEEGIQEDGHETTRESKIRFMALHLWYHSGQLNFIQTLLGDDGWNWK